MSESEENVDITDEEVEEVTVQSESSHYGASAAGHLTSETLGIGLQQMHEDTAKRERLAQADKRAHHNALERKRRDHIKDSFVSLRDAIPTLQGEKVSRAQILKKAGDYIDFMMRKNQTTRATLDNLRSQNRSLEQQLLRLERTHSAGRFVQEQQQQQHQQRAGSSSSEDSGSAGASSTSSDSSGAPAQEEDDEQPSGPSRSKRIRVGR